MRLLRTFARSFQESVRRNPLPAAVSLGGLVFVLLSKSTLSIETAAVAATASGGLLPIGLWGWNLAAARFQRRDEPAPDEDEPGEVDVAKQRELRDRREKVVNEVRKTASLESASSVLLRHLLPSVRLGYAGVFAVHDGRTEFRAWRGVRKPGAKPVLDTAFLSRTSKCETVRIDAETVRRSRLGQSLRGHGLGDLQLFRLGDPGEAHFLIAYSQHRLDSFFGDDDERTGWLADVCADVAPHWRELQLAVDKTGEAERQEFVARTQTPSRASAGNVGARIHQILRLLRETLEVDRVAMYSLHDPSPGSEFAPAAVDGVTVPPGVERTWRDQERTLMTGIPAEATVRLNAGQLRDAGVTSLIATAALTPVVWHGRPVAVLIVSHRSRWSPASGRLELLPTCAEQIAGLLQSKATGRKGSDSNHGESSSGRDAFLAKVSHELRTPVCGILGVADLALGTDLTAEQREYLSMVKSSSSSLMQLLNDVLDLAKMEAGGMQLERIEFPLRKTVLETARSLAVAAHQKGLELCVDLPADVPDGLIGDPLRLRQVLTNLIGNAVKYTSEGEIIIAVSAASADKTNCRLKFEVHDTGRGVPEEARKRIFQMYEQSDASDARTFGGSGLGLPICRELVELMGGEIAVEAGAKRGSVFHFTTEFGRCESGIRLAPADARRSIVWIVDDHRRTREVLADWLKPHVAGVRWARSAEEAIAQLGETTIPENHHAVILLDTELPGGDGIVVAAQRHCLAGEDVAVVGMRGLGRPGNDATGLNPPETTLIKPVDPSELFQVIAAPVEDSRADLIGEFDMTELLATSDHLQVLLAEDEKVNRLLAARILQAAGHTVDVVENGRQAVEAAARQDYDLIFMDLNMPELDGVDATREIRAAESAGRHTPIVCLSASTFPEDRRRCEQAGMDGFCIKPLTAKAIRKCVAEVFGRPVDSDAADALFDVLEQVRMRN